VEQFVKIVYIIFLEIIVWRNEIVYQ